MVVEHISPVLLQQEARNMAVKRVNSMGSNGGILPAGLMLSIKLTLIIFQVHPSSFQTNTISVVIREFTYLYYKPIAHFASFGQSL